MAFGTFDRLHPGHVFFLRQAKKLGGKLVVVVARDKTVHLLKNCAPQQTEKARAAALRRTRIAERVVLGDIKLETYSVIKKLRPTIIALGYDQNTLAKNLRKCLPRLRLGYRPIFRRIPAYKPHRYKTSLLRHT